MKLGGMKLCLCQVCWKKEPRREVLVASLCTTLQSTVCSVSGYHHVPWAPMLFVPTAGSFFHCVHCGLPSPVLQRVFSPTTAGWRDISSRTASAQEVSSLNGTLVSLLFWLDTALSAMRSAACCWYVSNAGMR